MKNRVFSFVLAVLVGLFTSINIASAQSIQMCGDWEDVLSDQEGYDDMLDVCELNWIRGGGGRLNLENKLKRIELVAVVNRVLKVDTSGFTGYLAYQELESVYNDLGDYEESRDWMYRALYFGGMQEANFNQKFWKGYEDGSFKMTNDISFAEFSKLILFAFEKMDELNGNFRLAGYDGEQWYSNYFNFFESKGVLEFEGDKFVFDGEVYSVHDAMTRHDAIKFIARILEREIYVSGKEYDLNDFSLELPFYLEEEEGFGENVRVWKDTVGVSVLGTVKVLEGVEVGRPTEFVSVYVPTRINQYVKSMYRIDRCNEESSCVRAFWLVLNSGHVLMIEGNFSKEKTALGEKAVNQIIDSISFN